MAGMKVVNISSRADGCVDLDAATAKKRGVDVKIVKFSVAGNGKSIIENQERKSGAGISYSTKTNITGRRTIFNE